MLGFNDTSTIVVIMCRLPEKGRKEIVEEMKERDREDRGAGMKVKKQKKQNIHPLTLSVTRITGLSYL